MRRYALVLVVAFVVGCATQREATRVDELVSQGKLEEAWLTVAEASSREPRNAELRGQALTIRARLTQSLVTQADAQRAKGQDDDAIATYRRLLSVDPQNPLALQRLDTLLRSDRVRAAVAEAETALERKDLDGAEARARVALALDSRNARAIEIQRKISDAREEAAKRRTPALESLRKTVTLDFKDASLKGVVDVLASTSGVNIVLDKDVKPDQKTTIIVRNASIRDALDLILLTNQLEYRVINDNSILIYPSTAQKQREYQPLVVRSFYLTNADAQKVANVIRTLVKTRDIAVDEKLNIVMVRDTAEAIRLIERLVAVQDLAEAEVMLEVEVLEIARSRLFDLGIRWPDQLSLTPLATNGQNLTLNDLLNLSSRTVGATVSPAVITARTEGSAVSLLANPRIRVRNREKARILIGERVPNITSTSTSTGFVSENVQYIDVGLKLEVEATISLDDEVAIRIALEVSNIINQITTRSGTVAYRIGTRNASTLLRLKDGENQVLAGLLSDEERMSRAGVPILSQPPILDRLFGTRSDQVQRTEIVLSITPRLVRQVRRPDPVNIEFEAGTEASLRQRATDSPAAVTPTMTVPARPAPVTLPSPITPGASMSVAPGAITQPPAYTPPTLIPTPPGEITPPPPPSSAQPPGTVGVAPGTATSNLSLRWVGPAQVALRDDFSADLVIEPKDPLQSVPVVISFDPQSVQVISVDEGGALSSGGAQATLNFRIDAANGQVFATVVRNATVADARAGTLLTVRMRPVKPAAATSVNVVLVQATLPDGRVAIAAPVSPLTFSIAP
jgi:general secretion pathway protein D